MKITSHYKFKHEELLNAYYAMFVCNINFYKNSDYSRDVDIAQYSDVIKSFGINICNELDDVKIKRQVKKLHAMLIKKGYTSRDIENTLVQLYYIVNESISYMGDDVGYRYYITLIMHKLVKIELDKRQTKEDKAKSTNKRQLSTEQIKAIRHRFARHTDIVMFDKAINLHNDVFDNGNIIALIGDVNPKVYNTINDVYDDNDCYMPYTLADFCSLVIKIDNDNNTISVIYDYQD